jgi:cobalt/nickel transport system permease protein
MERQIPLIGMTAAFVFAAQMNNFPVAPGVSGHFLGATLAAILLGPANAVLVMAVVLGIQCLGFADGGVTALGTNFVNMAVIPTLIYFLAFVALRKVIGRGRRAFFVATALSAWLSVVAASAACSVEFAASGTTPLVVMLPPMLFWHALIGGGEAVITCTVLSVVFSARPDLVAAWRTESALGGGGA